MLNVNSGSDLVVNGTLEVFDGTGTLNHDSGTITVNDGAFVPPSGPYTVGGDFTNPTLVLNNSTMDIGDTLSIQSQMTVENAAVVEVDSLQVDFGTLVIDSGGRVESPDVYINDSGFINIHDGGVLDVPGQLEFELFSSGHRIHIGSGGTVDVGGSILFADTGTNITVNAGTLALPPLGIDFRLNPDPIVFNSGTMRFKGDSGVNGFVMSDFLDEVDTLPVGKHLAIDGDAILTASLTIDGGKFSAGSIVNAGLLHFVRGTVALTGDDLEISGTGLFGPTIALPSGQNIEVTNTATVDPAGLLDVTGGTFSAGTLVNQGVVHLAGLSAALNGGGAAEHRADLW